MKTDAQSVLLNALPSSYTRLSNIVLKALRKKREYITANNLIAITVTFSKMICVQFSNYKDEKSKAKFGG